MNTKLTKGLHGDGQRLATPFTGVKFTPCNSQSRFMRAAVWMIALMLLAAVLGQAQGAPDPMKSSFQDPPNSAKPRVWWHWVDGNVSKEGIKLDLEWMNRVGIGGFQNFDAALGIPKLVDKPIIYMTPDWKETFLYTTTLADQLGLEEAIAGSPGWSESGGPWVKPEQAMKKVVWSETRVEGGKPFSGSLAKPPSVSGPFQGVPLMDAIAFLTGAPQPKQIPFYVDTAVIAYRVPDGDVPIAQLHPTVTSSGGHVDAAILWDGDLLKSTPLPISPVGQQSWIQFDFGKPQSIRALTFALGGPKNQFEDLETAAPGPDLEASDDGQNFRKIATVPATGAVEITVSFPEVRARYYRVVFTTRPPQKIDFDLEAFGIKLPPMPTDYPIAEVALQPGARVNHFQEKAGFATTADLYRFATPPVDVTTAVRKADVVDLTSRMRPDGTLDWTPPSGHWTILRLGYSLTGVTNHPASPAGTGLEVDKLSREHVKDYFTTYLDNYRSAVGPLMGKHGLQYVINDSWEAGTQNWTEDMIEEFTKRRGYDPRPWLPVLTGVVVESSEASDGFLWDYRKTLGEHLTENHYDQLETLLQERGMGHYGEAHEEGRAFIGDGMEAKRANNVPMGAMWTQLPGVNAEQYGYNADIRESASVSHIYGQNLVAAESMTASLGPWSWSPQTLKPTADKELAMGLNRFVIHTSVHQPLLDKTPGISLGPFGQWFTRNETWSEPAKAWVSYLARSSYMLQQGRFSADILYYYGEDSNLTALFAHKSPPIPEGYNFDYVNADALIHKLSVTDGQLVTPSGMSYRVLALDPFAQHMSLPVLQKIRDLVNAGAIVSGPKPVGTPSLADDANEFRTLIDQLWDSGAGEHTFGKGKVYGGRDLASVMAALHVLPDFEYTKSQPDTNLLFVHRKLPGGDIYWVNNRNDRDETLEASFRVDGNEAELWHADTGTTEPASYRMANGRTTVPLKLEPWGAVFVVFRAEAKNISRTLPATTETPVGTAEGTWTVSFQPDRGAPPQITLEKLNSWTENPEEGVKYFSGTATYTRAVNASPEWFKSGSRMFIDLGDVNNIAEVSVNGKPLGVAWKKPFRVDATEALKPGANELEIKVTDLWVNRMIGDRQLNASKKYTFTSPTFYKPDSPLLPSGLLGPVQIIRVDAAK